MWGQSAWHGTRDTGHGALGTGAQFGCADGMAGKVDFICNFAAKLTHEIAISTTSMQTVNDKLWLFHMARKNKN